jgi:hypothetical protein
MTVRQVFYQATVRALIDKTEAGYDKIQRDLVLLRRAGLPYDWIADNTRWVRKPRTYGSPEEALRAIAAHYRRSLWRDAPVQVQLWIEKDALAGVVYETTELFDVPLLVARGYSSLSFLHSAAEAIRADGRPAFIYQLGDHDPSGVDAARKVNETLREFAPEADITFERLAVLPHHIRAFRLPNPANQAIRFASEEFPWRFGRARRHRPAHSAFARPDGFRESHATPTARGPEGGRGKRARQPHRVGGCARRCSPLNAAREPATPHCCFTA